MGWFTSPTRKSGWLVVELEADRASYVHGRSESKDKPQVSLYGRRSTQGLTDAERLAKEMHFSRYQCATLLHAGEYQLMQVESPNVPAAELKSALRWKLKDLLDYPVDEATVEVLEIPSSGETAGRAKAIYAIAARNDNIRSCIKRFEDARIPLAVIDIPETAQRNIAALYEEEGRGIALLYVGDETCLLTVNFHGELLLARRIEFGLRQFAGPEADRNDAFERVGLELQRTFDMVDRQYPQLSVGKLMLAPLPQESEFQKYLEQNLTVRIEPIELSQALQFGEEAPDAATQWRLFHLFGASLRH